MRLIDGTVFGPVEGMNVSKYGESTDLHNHVAYAKGRGC